MIARRSFLVYAVNLLGATLGYVAIFVVLRFMPNGLEALGVVAFGLGFVGSFFVLTGLGLPNAHTKRVSEGEPLERCMGTYLLLISIQIALAAGGTVLSIYVWTEVLGRGFETPVHEQAIYVFLLYYLALSLSGFATVTFNARLETARSQAANLAGTLVRVGADRKSVV